MNNVRTSQVRQHRPALISAAAAVVAGLVVSLLLMAGTTFTRGALASNGPGLTADVLVNDPTDDTPENTTQSETTLAVLGTTVCGGYNNSGPGGFSGLSRSANQGTAWADLGGIGQSGDASLAVHRGSGTFYYAELANFAGVGANPGIGVAISTTDCQSFGAPVNAAPGASALAGFQDKPWIAVDNTGGARDGDIYVCWTRFIGNPVTSSELRFSRSIDGGATYQDEQILAAAGSPFGCSIEVGPNGEVYVTWAQRSTDDILFRSGCGRRDLQRRGHREPGRHQGAGNRPHRNLRTLKPHDAQRQYPPATSGLAGGRHDGRPLQRQPLHRLGARPGGRRGQQRRLLQPLRERRR